MEEIRDWNIIYKFVKQIDRKGLRKYLDKTSCFYCSDKIRLLNEITRCSQCPFCCQSDTNYYVSFCSAGEVGFHTVRKWAKGLSIDYDLTLYYAKLGKDIQNGQPLSDNHAMNTDAKRGRGISDDTDKK